MMRTATRRKGDVANLTINLSQLVTILVFAWGAFQAYDELRDRLSKTEARQIQLQSQIGETNARLKAMQP